VGITRAGLILAARVRTAIEIGTVEAPVMSAGPRHSALVSERLIHVDDGVTATLHHSTSYRVLARLIDCLRLIAARTAVRYEQ
jgi:hypothetical protein